MITKRTKILLGVLVLVAIGAYAYLYWWSTTPDRGFFENLPPIVKTTSDSAARAIIRPTTPAPVVPGTPASPATEGTPTVPSTTYRTFENSEFGFTFAYPDNWTPSQTKVTDATEVCLSVEGGVGGCAVSVRFVKESVNDSADKSLDALRAEFRNGSIAESTRRVGGQEATLLKVTKYPAGESAGTRAAVFMKDDLVFVLEGAAGQEAVFDRVADSFRFND